MIVTRAKIDIKLRIKEIQAVSNIVWIIPSHMV